MNRKLAAGLAVVSVICHLHGARAQPATDEDIADGVKACMDNVQPTGTGPVSSWTRKWTGDWAHCPVLIDALKKIKDKHDAANALQKSKATAKALENAK